MKAIRRGVVVACIAAVLAAGWLLPNVAVAGEPPKAADVSAAVGKGLGWLAKQQAEDGSWGGDYAGAMTSLALTAFLRDGNTAGTGPHAAAVKKAIAFLAARSADSKTGYLGGKGSMYEHALCVIALAEAAARTKDEKAVEALKRAVKVTLAAQNKAGGWRYQPQPDPTGDVCVTSLQVESLVAAKKAGADAPDDALKKAAEYIVSCQDAQTGGFTYTPGTGGGGLARTCAAVGALTGAGLEAGPARRGMEFMFKSSTEAANVKTGFFHYMHFHLPDAVKAYPKEFGPWCENVAANLLAKQNEDGSWDGSAAPLDKTYATAMSALILNAAQADGK